MNDKRKIIIVIAVLLFLLGGGFIVYMGRPVMHLQEQQTTSPVSTSTTINATTTLSTTQVKPSTDASQVVTQATVTTTKPTSSTTSTSPTLPKPSTSTVTTTVPAVPSLPAGVYTMTMVETHNSKSNCWTAINGSVYDLTSWVSRHPGGENPIVKLCGTNGTGAFQRKHGSSTKAQAALGLLKIGSLQ